MPPPPHLPHLNCYRIPGTRVIAGEYPFAPGAEAGREKLRRCLDAGITWFVDLTEAGESGLRPYEPALREEAIARGKAPDVEIGYTRLPIRDMDVPHAERMREIVERIDWLTEAGHQVYVHCWGGVGRTGTVAGCLLVCGGATGADALAEVARLFATMSPDKLSRHPEGSPQTGAQRAFVAGWRDAVRPAPDRAGRIRGALWGLAVGDAVGTTVEFMPPGTFAPVTDMVGGGPFRLQPGQWTDDTSMALCLAESLVERGGMDARDQMDRYLRWFREGHLSSTGSCFDIGNTTRDALGRYARTGDPIAGSEDRWSAGNGSIMRLAPVAMFHADDAERAIEACAESSRTTHGARVAVDACRYLGALLVGAFAGATKEELLSPFYSPVPGYWERSPLAPEIAVIAEGSFREKAPPEIRGTGYAAESLEAALWAFNGTPAYRDGCLAAVNLGDDADTTAAVYGQIAGAVYGESGIPAEWRSRLAHAERIGELADRIVEAGSSRE